MNERTIFLNALEIAEPVKRAAYLDQACAGDATLRQNVAALIKSHEDASGFLEKPAVEQMATSAFAPETPNESRTPTDVIDREQGKSARAGTSDETQGEWSGMGDHDLSFLAAATKPGGLGRLGHYEIQAVIGRGGFGIVLKGFDERLHRVVAIKVLAPVFAANGSARKRFIREARAAAAVKNEHVVGIYDVQEEAQPPFLVMECIDGISLQDKLDKHGTLGIKEILRIGMQIAEGLTAAHKQGLVHRDIKPANILLENGVERVKITDFGLARAVDDASVTQSGTVAGTPMYMSPEQAEGLAVDHRSDLFSLGTVLYAMCTGHPPFRASGTHAVLKRVIEASPRPIREVNPEIPDWLCDIIAKLHAKKPADRFQTAEEVAELLGKHLAEVQAGRTIEWRAEGRKAPGEAPAPDAATRPLEQLTAPRRWRWLRWAAAVAFVCAGGFLLAELAGVSRVFYAPSYLVALSSDDPGTRVRIWSMPQDNPPTNLEGDLKILGAPAYVLENLSTAELDLPAGNYLLVADLDGQEGDRQFIRVRHNYFTTAHHLPNADWKAGSFVGTGLADRLNGGGHRLVTVTAAATLLTLKEQKRQATAVPDQSGWVQLFNGKDLSGWTFEPKTGPNTWKVVDGDLVGRDTGHWNRLVSDRGVFRNFHLRARVKVSDQACSYLWFRCARECSPGQYESGWKASINSSNKLDYVTGSLCFHNKTQRERALELTHTLVPPDTWFDFEVIANGRSITSVVNGKSVGSVEQTEDITKIIGANGCIVVAVFQGDVHFQKIEIKELPPEDPVAVRQFALHTGPGQDVRVPGLDLYHLNNATLEAFVTPLEDNGYKGPVHVIGVKGQFSLFTDDKGGWNFGLNFPQGFVSIGKPNLVVKGRTYHVAGVRQGNEIRLYVDGKLTASKACPDTKLKGHGDGFVIGSKVQPLLIGGVRLSTIARYNKDFTPPARLAADKDTEAAYLFDEGAGDKLIDSSGHAHHGNITGAAWVNANGSPIVGDLKAKTPDEPGWIPLFNGKDLTGWETHPDQPGKWVVKDDAITCSGPLSHLYSKRSDFRDFHLRAEVKINPKGDGGILGRTVYGTWQKWDHPNGYKAHIEGAFSPTGDFNTGSLFWDGLLARAKEDAIRPDEWFTLEMIARGKRLSVALNGKVVASVDDEKVRPTTGRIALQHYSALTSIHFRKIEIKDLPPEGPGFLPLFNGKDFDGWKAHVPGDKVWEWENGTLVARTSLSGSSPPARLESARTFKDFELRFQARILDSEMYLRLRKNKLGNKLGFTPITFGKGKWGSVPPNIAHMAQANEFTLKDVRKFIKEDDYNDVAITCVGDRIMVKINGMWAYDGTVEGAREGSIEWAVPIYNSQVYIRKIEIKELPPAPIAEKGVLDFAEIHDADDKRFDEWIAKMKKDGFRPVCLSVQATPTRPRYAATALRSTAALEWDFSRAFGDQEEVGAHLKAFLSKRFKIAAHAVIIEEKLGLAVLWVRDDRVGFQEIWEGADKRITEKVDEGTRQGQRVLHRSAGVEAGQPNFVVTLIDAKGIPWKESINSRRDEFQAWVESHKKSHWRLDYFCSYGAGADARFAGVLIQDANGPDWDVSWRLTPAQYEAELATRKNQGFRPQAVGHEDETGALRFSVIWIRYRLMP